MRTIMHDSTIIACRQSRHTRVHRAGSRQAVIKCPSWCETNHDIDPDGGHDGPSWPNIPSLHGNGIHAVAISTGDWDDHGTVVHLEAQCLHLTPEQAHTAGLALLSAASWAKDHKVSA